MRERISGGRLLILKPGIRSCTGNVEAIKKCILFARGRRFHGVDQPRKNQTIGTGGRNRVDEVVTCDHLIPTSAT